MAYKDILLHLDGGRRSATRLRTALDLAARHRAHLTGLVVMDLPGTDMFYGAGMPFAAGAGMDQTLSSMRTTLAHTLGKVREDFLEELRRTGIEGECRTAEGETGSVLALHARYADLTVLGQPDPEEGASDTVLVAALMTSGRPVLAIPHSGTFDRIGDHVLVAWNGSREATRALNDALPILTQAGQVTICAVNPKHGIAGDGAIPAADIALHLARHGVKAEAAHTVAKDIGEADVLLSYASDIGADMMVCGGYGHSRAREMVFGGVTRTLLQEMTVPILLSH